MLETLAAIPPLKSAILTSGVEDECTALKLDLYLEDGQYDQLKRLRGKRLVVTFREDT